ncbi:MAG TPA: BtpA/SgcQ family protein [Tepidisphaeraceae bacterium]|nr:BtpA/SgcQ family protein [Tepidisphaeraceae bacterium]
MASKTCSVFLARGFGVIGMIHLLPLPGAPRFAGNARAIAEAAIRDAALLAEGGVHALMIENFGDAPFYPGSVPAHVVAHLTSIAGVVRSSIDLPLGINCLRNDGRSALAIAQAVGAEFIRVNVLCGVRVADQGLLHGIAHDLLRDRASLGAEHIKIMADVDVKHSAPLAARSIEDEIDDTLHRGMADALVVSGAGTGKATDPEKVARVKKRAGSSPVFIGSGVTIESLPSFRDACDGAIVGTHFKKNGRVDQPVDVKRVRAFMSAVG